MKKNTKIVLSLILTLILIFLGITTVKATYLGDVDQDGKVTSADSRLILRFSVGMGRPTRIQATIADVDQDGEITAADARLALRMATGINKLKSINTIYTKSLKKGDCLKFTGNGWAVYNTKTKAKYTGYSETRYLKNGEKITIKEIDENVIKINNNEYIYYGATANKYFTKVKADENKRYNCKC